MAEIVEQVQEREAAHVRKTGTINRVTIVQRYRSCVVNFPSVYVDKRRNVSTF